MFEDKVLLITGGTGSFGHAVLRRILPQEDKMRQKIQKHYENQVADQAFIGM